MSALEKKVEPGGDFHRGELEAGKILAGWRQRGVTVGNLADVATRLGLLVSASLLSERRAQQLIDFHSNALGYDSIHSSLARAAFEVGRGAIVNPHDVIGAANDNEPSLPIIDPRQWSGCAVPERNWLVPGFIPARTVTLLSGEGGAGKSQIALQLMAAMAFQTDWLGKQVTPGQSLYYGAEDDSDELHRRFAAVLTHVGKTFDDCRDMRLIPLADRDALLAAPNERGKMLETVLFPVLRAYAKLLQPKLIVLDTAADVFGGDEIKRAQVRPFVAMLRSLAIDVDCGVLLLSHPSLTGINTGTGLSGNTAWSNSVRSRLYLKTAENDDDARTLRVMKANYGPKDEIKIRWANGVFGLDHGPDPVVGNMLDKKADELFIELLILLTGQGHYLSPSPSATYAPSTMAKHPKARGYSKDKLATAMQRLLDGNRIHIAEEGPPSRKRKRVLPGPPA